MTHTDKRTEFTFWTKYLRRESDVMPVTIGKGGKEFRDQKDNAAIGARQPKHAYKTSKDKAY